MSELGNRSVGRLIIGLSVITIGVLFTLDQLDLVNAHEALRWWPVALIVYGFTRLIGLGCRRGTLSGIMFLTLGGWLLLASLHLVPGFWSFWPVLLIIWGAAIILGRGTFFGVNYRRARGWRVYHQYDPNAQISIGVHSRRRSRWADESDQGAAAESTGENPGAGAGDPGNPGGATGATSAAEPGPERTWNRHEDDHAGHFSSFAFMGSVARKVVTSDFKGGDIVAVMGGGDIDLRSAQMANAVAHLEVNLIMGGVNLFIPETWSVEYQGLPVMGSVEDRSKRPAEARGRLLISGVILMSSVIIRN